MLNRRSFIKVSALATGSLAIPGVPGFAHSTAGTGFFALHPFIEENPDAVFIIRTNVDSKTNSLAMKEAGAGFVNTVFVPSEGGEGAIPVANRLVLKPNLTCRNNYQAYPGTEAEKIVHSMGIVSDANFFDGLLTSFKDLGVPGSSMYMRERSCSSQWSMAGFTSMAANHGVSLKPLDGDAPNLSPADLQWIDIPEGVWYRKIAYLWPVNSPDSFLINVAKFKSHTVGGLTLTAKNLQGTNAMPYVQHCRQVDKSIKYPAEHMSPTGVADVKANYARHLFEGIPRWEKPGDGLTWSCGLHQETWVTRCLDNHLASKVGLHVIEGIYGRDGDGFAFGPHSIPGVIDKTFAQDFMTNYIIFGKNAFHVDAIGHRLGGHEPGNVGLFHIARERGLAKHFNPDNIAVYEWIPETGIILKNLDHFTRYDIVTDYLGLSGEEKYHLLNQKFDYSVKDPVQNYQWSAGLNFNTDSRYDTHPTVLKRPGVISVARHDSQVSFELYAAENQAMRLEVLDLSGRIVGVPANGNLLQGKNVVFWDISRVSNGTYLYRFIAGGVAQSGKFNLMR